MRLRFLSFLLLTQIFCLRNLQNAPLCSLDLYFVSSHLILNFTFIFLMDNMQLYVFFISLSQEKLTCEQKHEIWFPVKRSFGGRSPNVNMLALAQNSVHSVLTALEEPAEAKVAKNNKSSLKEMNGTDTGSSASLFLSKPPRHGAAGCDFSKQARHSLFSGCKIGKWPGLPCEPVEFTQNNYAAFACLSFLDIECIQEARK